MKALVEVILQNMDKFKEDVQKTNNKAAAARARKVSLEIGKQLKEFRALSVANGKE